MAVLKVITLELAAPAWNGAWDFRMRGLAIFMKAGSESTTSSVAR